MNYFIRTFGCQMNKADSEIIDGVMQSAGHIPVISEGEADLVIINTCGVREHAVDRLYGYIRSLRPEAGPHRPFVAVGGCVAQLKKDSLFDDLCQVDCVFGTTSFDRLPEAATLMSGGAQRVNLISLDQAVKEGLPVRRAQITKAWLPISRGCDNYCAYCVVPYARGSERSRVLDVIVAEAESLAGNGFFEITLLGQNVNSYGNDLGEVDLFAVLLKRLDKIDGLRRIRFLTSHPKDLSAKTIEAIATSSSVCEHLHLPLQSGSDKVLASMKRGYDAERYLERVKSIRGAVAGISLTTDLIVGFPGENENDFAATMSLVDEIGFDSAFMFRYSKRAGTLAARLEETVPEEEKEQRLTRLIELQSKISLIKNREYIGREVEVFIEGPSRRNPAYMKGLTRTNKTVNLTSPHDRTGPFQTVRIDDATSASLAGVLCGKIG